MNPAEQSLVQALDGAGAPGPAFLRTWRQRGADDFRRLLLPTVRHEDWRYTSLKALSASALVLAPARPPGAPGLAAILELPPAPRLVLVNGRLDPALTDLSALGAGVRAGSLAAALAEMPEQLEGLLGSAGAAFRDHALAGLSAALFADGALVEIPAGAALPAPLHVVHLADGDEGGQGALPCALPRTLVRAGAGARATVVEHWAGRGASLTAAFTEVVLGEGAELELVSQQREAPQAFHLGMMGVSLGAGSRFAGRSLALGARLSRVEVRAVLEGEKATLELDGLAVGAGSQLHDHHVHVDHARPGGTSRQLFKSVLDGQARGVFTGRVLVREGAQRTDAGQVSSSLLLSEDAIADARPQLEILADDVKCSHGGTVGQLDEAALFYLRTRAIDPATARALLTWAFAAEMVERLPASLRPGVRALVTARLPGGDRLREAA